VLLQLLDREDVLDWAFESFRGLVFFEGVGVVLEVSDV
jgi:hypothetical protein